MTSPEQPSRFYATPAEIDAFLRQHFAEDRLLRFYQAVGDAVLDEIRTSAAHFRQTKEAEQAKHVYLAGATDVMDHVWDDRYFPTQLPDLT